MRQILFLAGLGLMLNTGAACATERLASATNASMIFEISLETGLLLGAVFFAVWACTIAADLSTLIRNHQLHQHSAVGNTRMVLLALTNTATAKGRITS